jgi:hypothetical protein
MHVVDGAQLVTTDVVGPLHHRGMDQPQFGGQGKLIDGWARTNEDADRGRLDEV